MREFFLEILDWKWFNGRDCIGVVFAYDKKMDIYHGYIGVGAGKSEERDCRNIISQGCRLTRNETMTMLGSVKALKLITAIPDKNWKT